MNPKSRVRVHRPFFSAPWYKVLNCAVKQPGLFTRVICGNGMGGAYQRKKCGGEDVHVVFNLLFLQFRQNFGQKTKRNAPNTELHYNILLMTSFFLHTADDNIISVSKLSAELLNRPVYYDYGMVSNPINIFRLCLFTVTVSKNCC